VLTLAGCSYEPRPIDKAIDATQAAGDGAIDMPLSPEEACTARYGSSDSFDLCGATATQCVFYVRTNGSDCTVLCAAHGGTCNESFDGDCNAIGTTPHNCGDDLGDQVCICTP
jgi:hypothetical protein